jgi:hypothetical protein
MMRVRARLEIPRKLIDAQVTFFLLRSMAADAETAGRACDSQPTADPALNLAMDEIYSHSLSRYWYSHDKISFTTEP